MSTFAADGILVTYASIQQAQSDLHATVARMDQQLNDLRQYLAPLISSWGGSASTDYQTLQLRWDQSAADLNAVLGQIARLLGTTHDNYRATESANTAGWGF